MTQFDGREEAYEKEFARKAEFDFKVNARRNKLLGLWAAELLNLSGDEAAAYAREVVIADFEEAGDADVVRKVLADLAAKSVEMTEPRLRKEMDRLSGIARAQILTES